MEKNASEYVMWQRSCCLHVHTTVFSQDVYVTVVTIQVFKSLSPVEKVAEKAKYFRTIIIVTLWAVGLFSWLLLFPLSFSVFMCSRISISPAIIQGQKGKMSAIYVMTCSNIMVSSYNLNLNQANQLLVLATVIVWFLEQDTEKHYIKWIQKFKTLKECDKRMCKIKFSDSVSVYHVLSLGAD